MNIEQAKTISIPDFLDRAGYKPATANGHEAWYIALARRKNGQSACAFWQKRMVRPWGRYSGNPFTNDAIILHSVSNVSRALPLIKDYDYKFALTWMDNDKAGRKAQRFLNEFCKTESGLVYKPMNKIYSSHKDPNAWHVANLNCHIP
jgi:hypothetical protein